MLRSTVNRIIYIGIISVLLSFGTGCERVLDGNEPPADPVAVFDELWTVIDEHYALFPVKGVDWPSEYIRYRAKISAGSSNAELFTVLSDMLQTLQDGHVTLISPNAISTYDNFYKPYPINFNYSNLLNTYLRPDYDSIGPVLLKVVNAVGYIYYSSFANDITDQQLDDIFNRLAATKALIVDVRNNTGGKSRNVDRLFSRFISTERLVKYEKKKNGPGHTDFAEPVPYYCSPSGTAYTKPVAVLTNRSCFSACNDFVLYMSGLPQVQLIGDQTGGGGAVPYDYLLRNGWKVQYSATITLGPGKDAVENGIPPHISLFISPIEETNGKDPILEKAFLTLQ